MRKVTSVLSLFLVAFFTAATTQGQLISLDPERTSHAATLLQSGKVLITGGANESAVLSSAVLYDPATGTITSTGSMLVARSNHTSTLLPDGRVLITGGEGQSGAPIQTAELYDPTVGTFSFTPVGMRSARAQHTATLLGDGTVLVVGGQNADIFDPSDDSFTQTTGSPVQSRKSHMATRLSDGTVLLSGGYVSNIASDTAEIYAPATKTFTATASPMEIPRANHTSTLLPSGDVLITGGFSGTSPHGETERYDPITQTFTIDTAMLFHRSNHRAILQGDGQVLIIGGVTLESGFLAVNELYDPATRTWTEHGQLIKDCGGHTATALLSGGILVAGGVTGNQTLQSAEILSPVTRQFTSLGNMQVPRNQHTTTLLQDGRVFIAAGSRDTASLTSAEIFNPADDSFTLLASTLAGDRKNHSATLMNDGRVLLAGGRNSVDGKLRTAELFDPATNLFTPTGAMNSVRALHTATLLNDGKPLMIGGVVTGGGETDTAEIYDPVTETFRFTIGTMEIGRKRHRSSLLSDGTVLVTGGTILPNAQGGGERTTETAELFDPTTELFSNVGSMSVARSDHDSVLLADDTVVITGGTVDPELGDVYTPGAQTFAPSASKMVESRGRLVSLRLKNAAWGSLQGHVLAIGGSDIGGSIFGGAQQALASVEIYDPTTKLFSDFGTMTVARQNHTATELNDGRILITGGVGRPFVSGTAELVAGPTPIPTPTPAPSTLGNISTRLSVQTDDNVLIGGFIVTGSQPKKVILRAIGPSLPVEGSLADPVLELNSGGTILATNDNWVDAPNKQEIIDSTVAPTNNLESAILTTLDPGPYTAIVRGVNNGTGVGLVEAYDLDGTVDSKLANISARGFVQTSDDVMIGGFIVLGTDSQRVIVRGIGPSLSVTGALADPTLDLVNPDGSILASNDNWRDIQEADIIATGVSPTHDLESAIVATLVPGAYTAIVRGTNGITGVALVEVYALPPSTPIGALTSPDNSLRLAANGSLLIQIVNFHQRNAGRAVLTLNDGRIISRRECRVDRTFARIRGSDIGRFQTGGLSWVILPIVIRSDSHPIPVV